VSKSRSYGAHRRNAEHSVAENFPLIRVERCLASAPNYSPHREKIDLTGESRGHALSLENRTSRQLPDVASKQDCRARRDAERDRDVD
jgi:hypothetical protein